MYVHGRRAKFHVLYSRFHKEPVAISLPGFPAGQSKTSFACFRHTCHLVD